VELGGSCRRGEIGPLSARLHRAARRRVQGLGAYYEHRKEGHAVSRQHRTGGKQAFNAEFGVKAVLPANDEYQLYWGFAFAWPASTPS